MKWMRTFKRNPQVEHSILLAALVFALGFAAGHVSDFRTIALSDTDKAFEAFWDAFSIIERALYRPDQGRDSCERRHKRHGRFA